MKVEKLEERWTPTTVQTTFTFQSLSSSKPGSGGISIDFPLLNLGWTFALSFTPEKETRARKMIKRACNWTPTAFSFRRHDSMIAWGSTSIRAQLSLAVEPNLYDATSISAGECTLPSMSSNTKLLGTMQVVLADTPSLELPLTPSCTLSFLRPTKVWLIVTISDCPLANGLFEARSGPVNEAAVQAQLVRRGGDRLLSRSLTTGKLFDLKFLTSSTRSTFKVAGNPLQTYASLSVLEEHIDLLSSVLREGWESALQAFDNTDANHVEEILCPEGYEYELDSDFEDEDEALPRARDSGREHDMVAPGGQHSKSGTERSASPLSPFELEGGPSDYERTIWVKFAAHRTWHAFLWYCYTGNLVFGKLKSQVEAGSQHLLATTHEGEPLTCSPKSMYRLADLVGDKDLRAKALLAIKEKMSEENVLEETFSVFTSKYPDVQKVQLDVLMEHCGSPKVKEAFLAMMEKYGSMSYARHVLSAFYDHLVA